MIAIALILIIIDFFLSVYVIWYGWMNVIVPVLSVPEISYWQMMAISFVIDAFISKRKTANSKEKIKTTKDEKTELLISIIAQLLATLLFWLFIFIGTKII